MADFHFTARPIAAADTHALRESVLRPGRPDDVDFAGDHDPDTFHAGAFSSDQLVAIASVCLEARETDTPGTSWRLRGMASDPAVRGQGAGRAVLELCEQHVRERGGTTLWCNARTVAIGFYEAHGWRVLGEEFDIPSIGPHYVMERPLG